MGGEFFSMEDERDRWKGRAERAEARADGMERAGAEQARRADENQADMVAWRARAEAAEARVKELEAENHRCWQARDESDRRITQLEADLAAANSAVEDVLPELRNYRKQRDVQVHAMVADVVEKARVWAAANAMDHRGKAQDALFDAIHEARGIDIRPVETMDRKNAQSIIKHVASCFERLGTRRSEAGNADFVGMVKECDAAVDLAEDALMQVPVAQATAPVAPPVSQGHDEAGGEGPASGYGPRWDADHLAMAERAIGPWHIDAPAAITHIIAHLRERDQRKG